MVILGQVSHNAFHYSMNSNMLISVVDFARVAQQARDCFVVVLVSMETSRCCMMVSSAMEEPFSRISACSNCRIHMHSVSRLQVAAALH